MSIVVVVIVRVVIVVLVIVSVVIRILPAVIVIVVMLLVIVQAVFISSEANADIRPNSVGPLSHLDRGADIKIGRRLPHNINIWSGMGVEQWNRHRTAQTRRRAALPACLHSVHLGCISYSISILGASGMHILLNLYSLF